MASTAPLFCFPHEPTDEQLFVAALRGDESAWTTLVKRLDRYLLTGVRRRIADLPDELRQDVVQEVWAAVVTRRNGSFNPSTSSARHYVAGFLGLAVDRVRAAYRAPGERSRRRDATRSGSRRSRPHLELVSFEELTEEQQPEDSRSQLEQRKMEARLDIMRAKNMASSLLAQAIDVMWKEDSGYEAAAAAVGINRLTLRRQLRQLGLRLAA
jgi:DNA-directed RNA polymerase specialized sigma24 family protein